MVWLINMIFISQEKSTKVMRAVFITSLPFLISVGIVVGLVVLFVYAAGSSAGYGGYGGYYGGYGGRWPS